MPAADIIIPAYNNARGLPLTLRSLFHQSVPGDWSVGVIISDDGSTDETAARGVIAPPRWRPTVVVRGPHRGSAAARNRALQHSQADLVIFLGADIVMRPGALAAHLNFHTAHPASNQAALGMITWDPRLNPSPLMEWMTHGGGQNDFDSLLGQATADPRHFFYGSHLSLKRQALGKEKFPEVYRQYGWEDLDLGRRLSARLTLRVLPEAHALHRHFYTPRDIWRRQYRAGQSLPVYQQRYPNSVLIPPKSGLHASKINLFVFSGAASVLRLILSTTAQRWSTPRLFALFAAFNLWRGVYDTLKRGHLRPNL